MLPPAADPRHPYRVEVALPPWVLDGDPALRRWLFSYGGALRLEDPQGLVEEQSQWLKDALAALGPSPAESSLEAPDRCGLVRVGGREWGWPWSPQAAPNKRQRPCPSLPAVRWTLGANGAVGVAERGAGVGRCSRSRAFARGQSCTSVKAGDPAPFPATTGGDRCTAVQGPSHVCEYEHRRPYQYVRFIWIYHSNPFREATCLTG